MVFHGDSLTFGVGSTGGLNYPAQTIALMPPYFSATNLGVSGQTITQMITTGVNNVDPLFGNNFRRMIGWGGTNDLAIGGDSAATLYANMVTYATARKAAGWKVILIGILPRGAGAGGSFETRRTSVNASLRADFSSATAFTNIRTGAAYADYFIDIEGDADLGQSGDELNPTFYTDEIHLTNAGYAIIAAYALNALSFFP